MARRFWNTWHKTTFHIACPLLGEFTGFAYPTDSRQRGPAMQTFDVFFLASLNKLLKKTKSKFAGDLKRHVAHVTLLQWYYRGNYGSMYAKLLRVLLSPISWWRHQMEKFSALLAICAGTGEFPTQRPVTRSFDVFFVLRLNKRLSKQSWGWWLETLSRPLWRHCNVPETVKYHTYFMFITLK